MGQNSSADWVGLHGRPQEFSQGGAKSLCWQKFYFVYKTKLLSAKKFNVFDMFYIFHVILNSRPLGHPFMTSTKSRFDPLPSVHMLPHGPDPHLLLVDVHTRST